MYIKDKVGLNSIIVRNKNDGLQFILFSFLFLFLFWIILHFSIFSTLRLGLEVIDHISHIRWCSHNIDYGTKEKKVEGFRKSDIIQHIYHMLISWSFRVGYTVVSTEWFVGLYKIDYFVESSLSSFLVFTLIQEFVLLSNSKGLSS